MSVTQISAPAAGRTARPRPHRRPVSLGTVVRFALIIVVLLVTILPIAWMVLGAFKTNVEIGDPSKVLTFTPTLSNFADVFGTNDLLKYLINSAIVAGASTLASLLLGVPAAWAIARFRMERFNTVVLLARVVPAILLLVPWYYLFSQIGLVGGYGALILSHMFVGLPLVTWIMSGFFASLPEDMREAGQIDGLTEFGCFLRIDLPLSMPGIATATILAVIFSWNNFLFSLILAGSDTLTLPVVIFQFMSYAGINWGGLMAGASVMTMPIIVFALFAQKYVVGGLTAGATKG